MTVLEANVFSGDSEKQFRKRDRQNPREVRQVEKEDAKEIHGADGRE